MKNIGTGLGLGLAAILAFSSLPPTALAVDGEITYTGANTDLTGDDIGAGPFNLGFPFNFYGTSYTQTYVNINGTLNFAENYSRYSNVPLSTTKSDTNISNNSIYAFWDDLNTNGDKIIYYATVGDAPNRKFVTQWTNIYFHGTTIQLGTFQVILYEGSDVVQIQYRDLLGGSRALGDSATVGIRKDNSTYSQYSHNTASLSPEQAIRYTPNGSGGYTVDANAEYDLVYLIPEGAPTSPVLVNPPAGSSGVTLRPTFEWLPVENASTYTVLVSTTSNFSSTVVNESGVSGTSYTLQSDLDPDATYYWRVQSVNGSGSSLSPTRTFQTGSTNAAPDAPSAVSSSKLLGGAESLDLDGAELSATLSDPDEGEELRYRIQIASNASFDNLAIDYRSPFGPARAATYSFGETDGTYLVGSATTTLPVGSYYLRIRAEDDAAASSAWHAANGVAFKVVDVPPDADAPAITEVSVDPEETSALVRWLTDEAASSQVEYGPAPSHTASTTESDTVDRATEHEVELVGLRACVTYSFKASSRDAAGNRAVSASGTFTTKGCTGAAAVSAQSVEAVDRGTGGTVSLVQSGKGLSLSIPANFASSSLNFQIKKIDEDTVLASTSRPESKKPAGSYTYALHAVTDDLEVVEEFDEPLTLTLSYDDADVEGLDESSLAIYRWTGSEWKALANCSVDEAANAVTCDTDHFSTFGLFGSQRQAGNQVAAAQSSGGASIQRRVANLRAIGDIAGAQSLAQEWQHLFAQAPVAATAPAALVAVRDLTVGMSGDDVRMLQELLLANGRPIPAGATGYFGSQTRAALAAYQAQSAIFPAAGYFGPLTRAQMKAAGVGGAWW